MRTLQSIFTINLMLTGFTFSAIGQANSILKNDTLTLSNSFIERQFLWNKGEIISTGLTDKRSGENLLVASDHPAFRIGDTGTLKNSSFEYRIVESDNLHEAWLEAEVLLEYESFKLKRVFRIADNVSVIACDHYIWIDPDKREVELPGLSAKPMEMDRLNVSVTHPKLKAIEFFDRTDKINNLVQIKEAHSFTRPVELKGNLLQITSLDQKHVGVFILKEAPCSFVQLNYPNYDFRISGNTVTVEGIGLSADDLIRGEWVKLYGTVVGCFDGSELGFMRSLRSYQKSLRKTIPERDEMIMMNTWGDRNRDASINEDFLKAELDACEKLGITHFQIDDGWQRGLSQNSADAKGDKWELWSKDDWKPHEKRLPNGLKHIVTYAKSKGIQLGLWFHPSVYNSYENWEADAEIILNLYRENGIRYFKIDGTSLLDKLSDHRFGLLFEKVSTESQGEIVINLDATAGNRTGYHYRNTFGNIFLENRYTDWGNYYPHWTLRNLWQLSAFVPTKNLQIEFLNKWRNLDKYEIDDPLAPGLIPFEYQFAITMMAQPLAWFEGTGLPNEAFELSPVIKKYSSIQAHIHAGDIFPIGNEPNGYSWTGFQSVLDEHSGYLLVFRENNLNAEQLLSTWLPRNSIIRLTPVLGEAEVKRVRTNAKQEIEFFLPKEFSFALYQYEVLN